MNKKGQTSSVGEIVIIFMAMIVGLALIGTIINIQHETTNTLAISNESTNLSIACWSSGAVNVSDVDCNITADNWYSSGDWRENYSTCYLGSVSVSNGTGSALSLNTDYKLFSNLGIIQILDTVKTNSTGNSNGIILMDYNYCGSGYNKDSSARGIAGLWTLFAALIIVSAGFYGIRNWI